MNILDLKEDLAEGNTSKLKEYLSSGGQPNATDSEWNCPLIFYAVLGGSLEATEALVKAGADVNLKADEPGATFLTENVLSLALQQGHLQGSSIHNTIAEYLIKNGAKDEI